MGSGELQSVRIRHAPGRGEAREACEPSVRIDATRILPQRGLPEFAGRLLPTVAERGFAASKVGLIEGAVPHRAMADTRLTCAKFET